MDQLVFTSNTFKLKHIFIFKFSIILRQWHSVFHDICSAELFTIKVLIPCDPLKMLIQDYGKNWSVPMNNGYKIINIAFSNGKVYDKKNGHNREKVMIRMDLLK